MQEEWLHLVNATRRNEDEIKDGEEPQLKSKSAVSHLPEGESAEERGKDMKEDFVPHIVLGTC